MVGTPVDRHLNPTLRNLRRSVNDLLNQRPDGALLMLRWTVCPGVTNIVSARLCALEWEVRVAYFPERIAAGNTLAGLT